MKGVTRVTASLLAAAMTAGLGTTAVFAAGEGGAIGNVVTGDTSVSTSWIEVLDKDSHVLDSTDPDDLQLWNLKDKKTNQDPNNYNLTINLPVGSSKTLSIKLDDKSTATSAFAYAETSATKDGKIDDKDTVEATDADGKPKATKVTDVVALENGTFTAKMAGDVTFYAYASDAVSYADDAKTKPELKDEDAAKFIKFTVHAYNVTGVDAYELKFEAHDSVYTADQVSKTLASNFTSVTYDKKNPSTTLPEKDTTLTAKRLSFTGTQYLNHAEQGAELKFTATLKDGLEDDSDENSTVIKYATTSSKYLTVTGNTEGGTVEVTGTAPAKQFAKVFAYVDKNNNGRYDDKDVPVSNELAVVGNEGVAVYRVYNPNSGEHLYTTDDDEVYNLTELGWKAEGTAWFAPETSVTPVHRVYNPVAGEHIYTTDEKEVANLVKAGWNDEGVKFYSASNKYYAVARQYNPNAFANNHNYTANAAERTFLVSLGWKDEGVKLYATQMSQDTLIAAMLYND